MRRLLFGVLASCLCFALTACNTGSRGDGGGGQLPPDVRFPQLTSITPEGGRPGDLITLSGKNFSPIPSENRVFFTNFPGNIEIPGVVESVVVGPFIEGEGAISSLRVRVPTGVRSGFVGLSVETDLFGVVRSGGQGFTAAPVLLGYAINDDGRGFAVQYSSPNAFIPGEVTLIGYNLVNNLTGADVFDGTASAPSPGITNGVPLTANYTLPVGLEAVVVSLPGSLLPTLCETSTLEITVEAPILPTGSASNPIEIPYARITGPVTRTDIAPYLTGVALPVGVRSGIVDIAFHLASDPVVAKWDVLVEYQDPADPSGTTFVPCVELEGTSDATQLVPGSVIEHSGHRALIGPGSLQTFRWDTRANFPPGSGPIVTRLRLSVDPDGHLPLQGVQNADCAGTFLSGEIVIDNDPPPTGAVQEPFDDFEQESPASTAFWGGGVVTGVAEPAAVPNYGAGTVDVLLETGREYELNTDFGVITDLTNINNPIDLIPLNPGASDGEFHVRSLVIEEGANLFFSGSKPVVIRASGDGDDDTVVVSIAGDLHFDGESASNAAGGNEAAGGAGSFAGGGAGGRGARVEIDTVARIVTGLTPAEPGFGAGAGGSGASNTLVRESPPYVATRAGQGGGAGHRFFGEPGQNELVGLTQTYNAPSGAAGHPLGNSAITELFGGGGGGGGGAAAPRVTDTNFTRQQGGGGGGGGGAFAVIARGSVALLGAITANGGDGSIGTVGSSAGAGGGGAGGSILVRATGHLDLGADASLEARGGFGGFQSASTTQLFRGGHGSEGRIRLEVNGELRTAGVNDGMFFPSIEEPNPLVTDGVYAGEIETGSGVDGVLDAGVLRGEGAFLIDTDLGKVFDSDGAEVFANQSGSGLFELSRLEVPAGVVLTAIGSAPLIFLVDGAADVQGVIDVSGEFGGIPDAVTDPQNPTPGLGGRAGAGGGAGGAGGFATVQAAGPALSGGLPPFLPAELIASDPTLGGGGGGGVPVPGMLALAARGGVESFQAALCPAGSGGGGGFGEDGVAAAVTPGCPDGGAGGNSFGSTFFLVPDRLDPGAALELLTGGGGGAGGGGYSDGATMLSPGSGGGGAGGLLQIASRGPTTIHATAALLARGGDAFQASSLGGNGGAGAGGAVRLRSRSRLDVAPGAVVDVRGGVANVDPGDAASIGYVPNGQLTGGDGAPGRVRVETTLGFLEGETLLIDPLPSTGAFVTAGLAERRAISRPYRVTAGAGVMTRSALFGDASVTRVSPGAVGTHVIALYEGAYAAEENPSAPGAFIGPTDDLSLLDGVEFIRLQIYLYSSETETPAIDTVEIPFEN